jgi:hypothetical protein
LEPWLEAAAIGEHETGNCSPSRIRYGDVISMDEFVWADFVKAKGWIAQFYSSGSTGHWRVPVATRIVAACDLQGW